MFKVKILLRHMWEKNEYKMAGERLINPFAISDPQSKMVSCTFLCKIDLTENSKINILRKQTTEVKRIVAAYLFHITKDGHISI